MHVNILPHFQSCRCSAFCQHSSTVAKSSHNTWAYIQVRSKSKHYMQWKTTTLVLLSKCIFFSFPQMFNKTAYVRHMMGWTTTTYDTKQHIHRLESWWEHWFDNDLTMWCSLFEQQFHSVLTSTFCMGVLVRNEVWPQLTVLNQRFFKWGFNYGNDL